MKAKGRYLIGIDFEGKGDPRVLVVPMRGAVPLWNAAEAITTDEMERIVEGERKKRRQADEPGGEPAK